MLQHVIDTAITNSSAAPTGVSQSANVNSENLKQHPPNVIVCNTSSAEISRTASPLASNLSVPLALPLSSLTSLPLALCTMNGGANISNMGNAVQAAASRMVAQPGLVLLNLAGNPTCLSGLSNLITPNQLQQPLLQQLSVSTESSQMGVSTTPATTFGQLPLTTNVTAPQVLGSVAQVPMQPTALPQQTPAAYMLVPIHQLPTAQSTIQPQLQATDANTPVPAPSAQDFANTTCNDGTTGTMLTIVSAAQASSIQHQLHKPSNSVLNVTLPNVAASVPNPATSFVFSQTSSALPVSLSPLTSVTSLSMPVTVNRSPIISSSASGQEVTPSTTTALPENYEAYQMDISSNQIQMSLSNSVVTESNSSRNVDAASVPNSKPIKPSTAKQTSSPVTPVALQDATGKDLPRMPEKRKKGPAPKLDGNEVCTICSDKASGYHYGVLSCEGCKGFFRRCIIKHSGYVCKEIGQCRMDSYTRRRCQACRLRRCREAGMKDENVFSEVHNHGTKPKKMKKDNSDSPLHPHLNSDSSDSKRVPTLSSHQLNVVEMLQANENRYQWPSPEDVEKLTPLSETGDSHRSRSARFNHFTELTILIVQLVVEFTKQLPGFLDVSREDQIILLKACTIEVMLLRAAKQYNKKNKAINVLNGKYYDKSSFYKAGMQVEFVDPIFDFCDSMAKLDLDEAEYALLVAINTFSTDRPNLKDLKKIEAIQDQYVELLRIYLKIHHPTDPLMFPRSLMKLVELRSLNNHHSEQMFALKLQDKHIPPLLAEIWDM